MTGQTVDTEDKAKAFALYLTTEQRSAITHAASATGTNKSAQRWPTETILKVSNIITEGTAEEKHLLLGLLYGANVKK